MKFAKIKEMAQAAYEQVEYDLLREELEKNEWLLNQTASSLECSPSMLHRALARHPKLKGRIRPPGRPTELSRRRRRA